MRVMEATGDRSIRESIDAGNDDEPWLTAMPVVTTTKPTLAWVCNACSSIANQIVIAFTLEQLVNGDLPSDAIRQIVLIGSTAPSLRDLFEVPFIRFHRGAEMFRSLGWKFMPIASPPCSTNAATTSS